MQNGAATSGRASTASGSTLRPTSIRWELGLSGIAVFNVPSARRGRKAASGLRALDLRLGRARLPAHAPAAARSVDEGRPAHAPTPPDPGSLSRRPARVSALRAHLLPEELKLEQVFEKAILGLEVLGREQDALRPQNGLQLAHGQVT